jgi:predicted transcriptional regulator of viral defense system
MPRPAQRLFAIAEEQWALVTRRQAIEAGIAPRSFARLLEDGRLERVAHGVYRVRGAGEPDHLELRAAWLQLDPATPAWVRLDDPDVALVSHASAANLYGVGDLRADVHEFTLPVRRQVRREDVRLHRGTVPEEQRTLLHGLPVTRAGRMIADLIADHVDPSAVAGITAQVVDDVFDYPAVIAERIAPYAANFGFRRGDGAALLDHLLMLADYKDRPQVMAAARGA